MKGEERDATGLCRIKDGFAYLEDWEEITENHRYKISVNRFANYLRGIFFSDTLDWKGQYADTVLERCYRKAMKRVDAFIKMFRQIYNNDNDEYTSISVLFLEYKLKERLTNEYERIAEIIENAPDSAYIDGVKWFEWVEHEVYHPGESVTDWKEREAREKKEFDEKSKQIFGKTEMEE